MKPEPIMPRQAHANRRRRLKRRVTNTCLAGACITAASMTAGLVILMEPAEFDRLTHRWPLAAGLAMMPTPPAPVPVFAPVLARQGTDHPRPAPVADRSSQEARITPAELSRAGRHPVAPTPEQTTYLIRATLIALDHANRTGNYSVLRELASTNFQHRNGPDHLASVFAGMRHSHVDLTAAALQHPRWLAPPALTPDNRLALHGTMPALPSAVAFDVRYSIEGGIWKLDAIDISPAKTQTAANG